MATELDSELLADFLTESGELLERLSEQLVSLEQAPEDRELLNAIFRGFHTIKGSAGFFELNPVVRTAHAAEEVFGVLRAGKARLDGDMLDAVLQALDALKTMLDAVSASQPPPAADSDLLQHLLHLAECSATPAVVAPVVIAKPALTDAGLPGDPFSDDEFEKLLDQLHGQNQPPVASLTTPVIIAPVETSPAPAPAAPAIAVDPEAASVRVDTHRLDQVMDLVGELVLVRNRIKRLVADQGVSSELRKAFSELDVTTSGLQNQVTRMRMQPIRKLFGRFPKLARDTARKLGKQVEVERIGEDTELDKTLAEALGDPLMHMVRNAVDHGLEMPDVRIAAGKPAAGRITLSAEQLGDQIMVTVRDDGAGMNAQKLRRKGLEKGLISAADAARMGHDESLQLVFMAGFSTKEQVSDLSGRGVGMDVVRSNILALNGAVSIESEEGRGSAIHIRVPLTLSIQPVLMIERATRLFAIPLSAVQDVFTLDPAQLIRCERASQRDDRGRDLQWEGVAYRDGRLPLLRLSRWTLEPDDEGCPHVVVVRVGNEHYGLIAGQVRGREEIVVKPLGRVLKGLSGVAGGTVTSDGRIALILEMPGLVAAYERAMTASGSTSLAGAG